MYEVPPPLQRLVDQVDGWLDLRCPERALDLLGPLLADPEGRRAGLVLRVRALARLGDYAAALRDLGELQQAGAADDWVDLTEAWCRRRLSDLPGAIRCTEQLIARNQRSDIGHFNLACYLALSGERDRAIDVLSLACGLNPECREFARDEPDFDGLRTDPRFRQLLRQDAAGGSDDAREGYAAGGEDDDYFDDVEAADEDAEGDAEGGDDDAGGDRDAGPDPAHN